MKTNKTNPRRKIAKVILICCIVLGVLWVGFAIFATVQNQIYEDSIKQALNDAEKEAKSHSEYATNNLINYLNLDNNSSNVNFDYVKNYLPSNYGVSA